VPVVRQVYDQRQLSEDTSVVSDKPNTNIKKTKLKDDEMGMKRRISTKNNLVAVVVCTDKRGVFFGYTNDTSGETITLTNCRNAYYWVAHEDAKGVLSLGSHGPAKGSKIGALSTVTLRGITAVIECTPAAVDAWEAAKWG